MGETQPHIDKCPGCIADQLTEEDRQYLRSTGWKDPQHVLAPKPQMAPPVQRQVEPTPIIAGCAVGMTALWIAPWVSLGVVVLTLALTLIGWAYHRADHTREGEHHENCLFCRRGARNNAEREWAEYRQLQAEDKARREAEAHAANYAHLKAVKAERERLRRKPD